MTDEKKAEERKAEAPKDVVKNELLDDADLEKTRGGACVLGHDVSGAVLTGFMPEMNFGYESEWEKGNKE